MLAMFHRVKQLVLVDELPNDEVGETCEQNLPGVSKDTVDHTDNEYEYSLGQEESIAENWGLYQFSVVCVVVSVGVFRRISTCLPRGVFAPINQIGYKERAPNSSKRNGNRPKAWRMMKLV